MICDWVDEEFDRSCQSASSVLTPTWQQLGLLTHSNIEKDVDKEQEQGAVQLMRAQNDSWRV
jgi:hypothetical protein